MAIELTTKTIRLLTLFENITNVGVKDCFENNNTVYYVVEEGKIGLAIGKNGNSIKQVERIVNKKVKVYEYSPDPIVFLKKLIPVVKEVKLINENNKTIAEIKVDKKNKGCVMGRGGQKIKIFKEICKRIHNISDIRVI